MRTLCYALVALCINAVSAHAQPTVLDPNLTVSLVADSLEIPSSMAFIGVDDILVLQKNDGKVRRVLNGALLVNPVLDVDVDPRSFGGLLGIAIHPNFQTNKYVYLFYTEGSGGNDTLGSAVANRIDRYTWDSASDTLTAPLLIMSLPVSVTSGNYSGVMAFGQDGKLYVTVGDQGLSGQLQNNPGGAAPNDTSVILRLNDDGTAPKNNPFYSQGGVVAKYFAYGIRNSFGMAFDPVSGKLWNTENGPANWDEINLVAPGFNSGWNKIQGPMSRDVQGENEADLFSLTRSRYSDPEFSWFESVGLTGMAFVDSLELGPEYENNLFIGDYVFGNLSRFELNKRRDGIDFTLLEDLRDKVADNANERNDVRLGTDFGSISDVRTSPDGLLYVLSISDGAIYVVHRVVEIGASSVADGELGMPFNLDLNLAGGTAPYTVTLLSGALPDGLAIVNDAITGTPTKMKKYSFSVQVTEQAGATTTKDFQSRIYRALVIATNNLPKGRVGRRYLADLTARFGKNPHSWSLVAGTLPAGLTMAPATGKITGTPTTAGTANLTFAVTDALGVSLPKALSIEIQP
ncbi:MAG: PQQ-dependent sugar dehydrogenase [Candidatus Binatia bacterium]